MLCLLLVHVIHHTYCHATTTKMSAKFRRIWGYLTRDGPVAAKKVICRKVENAAYLGGGPRHIHGRPSTEAGGNWSELILRVGISARAHENVGGAPMNFWWGAHGSTQKNKKKIHTQKKMTKCEFLLFQKIILANVKPEASTTGEEDGDEHLTWANHNCNLLQ